MSDLTYDIDPELLREFLDEAIDMLAPIEKDFLELEQDASNIGAINHVFRIFHSLKGNSPFFGLMKVKELSHKIENVLDKVRKQEFVITKSSMQVLLVAVDLLHAILRSVRDGGPEVVDLQAYADSIEQLDMLMQVESCDSGSVLASVRSLVVDLKNNTPNSCTHCIDKVLDIIDQHEIAEAEQDVPGPMALILEIMKENPLGSIDDNGAQRIYDALIDLKRIARSAAVKGAIVEMQESYHAVYPKIGFDQILIDLFYEKFESDHFKREQWAAGSDTESTFKSLQEPELKAQNSELSQLPEVIKAEEERDEAKIADPIAADANADNSDNSDKTMRVSELKVDGFLEYVGELLVVQEMFRFFGKTVAGSTIARDQVLAFSRMLDTFDSLSENLRKSILSIRTVPIKRVFQKLPRIVHDVAEATGKKVRLQISGDNLLVDKSYVEILDAPLVHIVRNSIDHGIESEQLRERAGKPGEGTVTICAEMKSSDITITVTDDGAGINFDAVQKKGIESGLIAEGEVLTESKLVDLLFEAGVSTADEVTDISGRGVGMDVVKDSIESFGGSISISSKQGQGTCSTIRLPRNVTTQIVDGFLVKINNENYVLPMSAVIESFSPNEAEISTVTGKGTLVSRHGNLQTLINMSELLKNRRSIELSDDSILVTVDIKGTRYAFAVDELLGVHKIVVKPVDDILFHNHFFGGAAITGDGRVAMVIDLEQIVLDKNF